MTLAGLLNRKVVTESGRKLGRIHDVRGELVGDRLRVTGFVTSTKGFFDRLGVGTAGSSTEAKAHDHDVIPWKQVVRVDREVVVRDRAA